MAYWAAQEAMPAYAHRYSPKKFTQHQLFACLVLKAWLKTDYRGVVAALADLPDLQQVIGLKQVPHFTTLHKAARRLLCERFVRGLLTATVKRVLRRRRRVPLAAADSSGFDPTHASRYYVWRAKRMGNPKKHMTYRWFPKLGVLCDTQTHLILAAFATRGPRPDVNQLEPLLKRMIDDVTIRHLVADAGYDSEPNHCLLREDYSMRSTIPPKLGRPRLDGQLPGGHYRSLMAQRFDHDAYAQRNQVETVISMLKRNLDSCIRARSYWSQCREMLLKVVTHNVMIAKLVLKVFYRAGQKPFFMLPASSSAGRRT